jgi:hypothetical protein
MAAATAQDSQHTPGAEPFIPNSNNMRVLWLGVQHTRTSAAILTKAVTTATQRTSTVQLADG